MVAETGVNFLVFDHKYKYQSINQSNQPNLILVS